MKLIIDISERDYKNVSRIFDMGFGTNVDEAIKNGVPLDDVKAEIEELDRYYDSDYFSTNNSPMYKCGDVLQILDNIGKADMRGKDNE